METWECVVLGVGVGLTTVLILDQMDRAMEETEKVYLHEEAGIDLYLGIAKLAEHREGIHRILEKNPHITGTDRITLARELDTMYVELEAAFKTPEKINGVDLTKARFAEVEAKYGPLRGL